MTSWQLERDREASRTDPESTATSVVEGLSCREVINWGLRHFACLRQPASNPNTRTKHQNLAKRLARERAARVIAGAGRFPARYQWPSANTNFGRARKVTKTPINDFPTPYARSVVVRVKFAEPGRLDMVGGHGGKLR